MVSGKRDGERERDGDEDTNTELCYQLPEDAAHSGNFEQLFSQLERCHRDLGISSFGISDTSLEEVCTVLLLYVIFRLV